MRSDRKPKSKTNERNPSPRVNALRQLPSVPHVNTSYSSSSEPCLSHVIQMSLYINEYVSSIIFDGCKHFHYMKMKTCTLNMS